MASPRLPDALTSRGVAHAAGTSTKAGSRCRARFSRGDEHAAVIGVTGCSRLMRGVSLNAAALLACAGVVLADQQTGDSESGFRFRSGVELINVAVTVTDSSGRFVPDLRQEDFRIYEDDVLQEIAHFSSARVPVSLGIVLDTSGSMAGDKFRRAQAALDRFLYDLLGADDEVFLYQFNNSPLLEEGWTTDRAQISRALRRIVPRGGTAMYDAVAEAIPLAERGRHRKKAVVVISDGNDTSSHSAITDVKDRIRRSDILVYAIGIDGESSTPPTAISRPRPPVRGPFPFPIPGRRPQWPPPPLPPDPRPRVWSQSDERVNAAALRAMTDDSGGRTEIIASARQLDPATSGIADELSRQYFLAYAAAAEKDGRWHAIRVEVKDRRHRVRARQGYFAT